MTNDMAHVLIIDDDALVRSTLRAILEHHDWQVTEADNGKAGLRQLGRGDFHLVITDILMPEREGLETIRDVRARHPDLPIIAMSGAYTWNSLDFLRMAEHFGAVKSLRKPFTPEQLMEAIAYVMSRGPSRRRGSLKGLMG